MTVAEPEPVGFSVFSISAGQWSVQTVLVTVTVNEQVAVLPEPSSVVQVTVVVPRAKTEPDGGLHVEVTPGQLSLAVGGG